MKTIVSDEAPNINADDNELLRIENDKKKEVLTAAKARLMEKYSDVRTLAPLVEQGEFCYSDVRLLAGLFCSPIALLGPHHFSLIVQYHPRGQLS